ncbi:MAG: cytidyltransferase [Methanobrevibacter sp.]|uniref:cytidyltransferase n=1 Tax=Methanobrevibacter sp. TaxID=66852 RepID=UPI0026DF42E3|nr:cytidyltransferase [Methanobrevibacter sp.]MDO5848378.1 cytidyltransferase [Methanobrevibacter sp.]
MIAISADFDPVHIGHEKLIKEGRKIADEKDTELAVYLNKGYSANHAPFFLDYESRREIVLELGADKVIPFEGLHHRLILSYSVTIRLSKMIDDGVTDYITAANIPLEEIAKKADKFVKQGNFVGMPKNYPNRNEIRWYAINEFLGSKLDFHVIKEVSKGGKVSGRAIRQSILENDLRLTGKVRSVIPKITAEVLEREIALGKVPGQRNYGEIYKTLNTSSRGNLSKIAYLTSNAINEIIKKRVYRDSETIWAAFRKANYGPVMTRLAISAIEEGVTKKEVMDLMKGYEEKGVIPPNQNVEHVINRAWYVANSDLDSSKANEKFRSGNIKVDAPLTIYAGLNLTKFEAKIMKSGENADVYVDKNGKVSVQMKIDGKKIKTNLRLPSNEVTYIRYILDSNFIPLKGTTEKVNNSYKIKLEIG